MRVPGHGTCSRARLRRPPVASSTRAARAWCAPHSSLAKSARSLTPLHVPFRSCTFTCPSELNHSDCCAVLAATAASRSGVGERRRAAARRTPMLCPACSPMASNSPTAVPRSIRRAPLPAPTTPPPTPRRSAAMRAQRPPAVAGRRRCRISGHVAPGEKGAVGGASESGRCTAAASSSRTGRSATQRVLVARCRIGSQRSHHDRISKTAQAQRCAEAPMPCKC